MNLVILSRKFDGVVGGVEKMVLELAVQMKIKGHDVTVISLDHESASSFYTWPSEVKWIKLGVGNPDFKATTKTRLLRMQLLRRILKNNEVDTAVGFQIGSFLLLRMASIGLSLRCIAAERNAPTLFNFIKRGKVKRAAANMILYLADSISVQSESNKKLYPWFVQTKIEIAPNPILARGSYVPILHRKNSDQVILYVGRVTYQKNLEVLIVAISKMDFSPTLWIVGDGDGLNEVVRLAKVHKVRLEVFPFTHNLERYFLDSNVFCLPSRWEGFPNVVGESLAHGLPVVAFEGCAGVTALVQDRKNGVLASGNDNPDSLAKALSLGLQTSWEPLQIQKTVSHFSLDLFSYSWEKILFPQLESTRKID